MRDRCFVVIRLTEDGDGVDIPSVHADYYDAQAEAEKVRKWERTKEVLVRQVAFIENQHPAI